MAPQPHIADPAFLAYVGVFALACLGSVPRARRLEDPDTRRGFVALRLTSGGCSDALVGFFVEDDGPGIPEDDREEVFESGYSTADDGTGFGLSIVSEIAEAHGRKIAATEGGAHFEISGVEPVE